MITGVIPRAIEALEIYPTKRRSLGLYDGLHFPMVSKQTGFGISISVPYERSHKCFHPRIDSIIAGNYFPSKI